ncbi:MAG: nucleotide exchange factor GrpE [Leptospirales bacterium]
MSENSENTPKANTEEIENDNISFEPGLPKDIEDSENLEAESATSQTDETVEAEQSEDTPEEMIEDLKEELHALTSTLQRERADFVNFRRRSQAEKEEANSIALRVILQEMLPAMDAFDQLFSVKIDENHNIDQFMDGVKLIRKQLWQSFSNLGVEELDPAGKEFDPNEMEALSVDESSEVEHEVVDKVYQKGYTISGKVLRAARVGVHKPAAKEKKEDAN